MQHRQVARTMNRPVCPTPVQPLTTVNAQPHANQFIFAVHPVAYQQALWERDYYHTLLIQHQQQYQQQQLTKPAPIVNKSQFQLVCGNIPLDHIEQVQRQLTNIARTIHIPITLTVNDGNKKKKLCIDFERTHDLERFWSGANLTAQGELRVDQFILQFHARPCTTLLHDNEKFNRTERKLRQEHPEVKVCKRNCLMEQVDDEVKRLRDSVVVFNMTAGRDRVICISQIVTTTIPSTDNENAGQTTTTTSTTSDENECPALSPPVRGIISRKKSSASNDDSSN